jgi:hypothetical protein
MEPDTPQLDAHQASCLRSLRSLRSLRNWLKTNPSAIATSWPWGKNEGHPCTFPARDWRVIIKNKTLYVPSRRIKIGIDCHQITVEPTHLAIRDSWGSVVFEANVSIAAPDKPTK